MKYVIRLENENVIKFCKKGHPRKKQKSGRITCPTCDGIRAKFYRNKDPEKHRLLNKQRVLRRMDKILEYCKRTVPDKKAYDKIYYMKNKERIAQRGKIYNEKRKELIKEKYRNQHPLLNTWKNMKRRCYDKSVDQYKNYGGRGIKVCERWLGSKGFENFVEDLFQSWEKGLSIERKDVNGDYEPNNCRWATAKEQANNSRWNIAYRSNIDETSLIYHPDHGPMTLKEFSIRSGIHLVAVKYRYAQHPANPEWILSSDYDNRYYDYQGHKYNRSELMLMSGLRYHVISNRLRDGWSAERAIKTPLRNI